MSNKAFDLLLIVLSLAATVIMAGMFMTTAFASYEWDECEYDCYQEPSPTPSESPLPSEEPQETPEATSTPTSAVIEQPNDPGAEQDCETSVNRCDGYYQPPVSPSPTTQPYPTVYHEAQEVTQPLVVFPSVGFSFF